MAARKLLLSVVVLGAMGALLWAKAQDERSAGTAMIGQAQAFLATLSEEQKAQTTFPYDSPERLNWHFIPRPRKGLPLGAMTDETRQAARALIRSGLSETGNAQAHNVMSLEEVLYLLESAAGDRAEVRQRRDPENYYISLFGEPSRDGTWGWRLEGHHLSLNYSIADGQVVASTPEFFGANPAKIDAGPQRTLRVLAAEEDIARQILKNCPANKLDDLWLEKQAADDIRGGGEPQPPRTDPAGLSVADMTADQKRLMGELLTEYLKNMPADVSHRRRQAIEQAGMDKIHFAWWGGDEPNQRHAYRVQGPTFLIEYNNTQNNANHIHSVWRDLHGDFNVQFTRTVDGR